MTQKPTRSSLHVYELNYLQLECSHSPVLQQKPMEGVVPLSVWGRREELQRVSHSREGRVRRNHVNKNSSAGVAQWLRTDLCTNRSRVQFLVRAYAGVAG